MGLLHFAEDESLLYKVARFNSNGTIDYSFEPGDGPNSSVNSLVIEPSGLVLAGGGFTTYNDNGRYHIVRITTSGSADSLFSTGSGANNTIHAIKVQSNGKVLIGGDFTSFNGISCNHFARLTTSGEIDTTFDTTIGINGPVKSIEIQTDNRVLIGGTFTSHNGVTRNNLTRLSLSMLDESFDPGTGTNNYTKSVALQSDGKILLGGQFTSYNGTSINKVARINSNGSIDGSFNPGTGPSICPNVIIPQSDGKILLGGNFGSYNGTEARNVVRINANGTLDNGFTSLITGAVTTVDALVVQNDNKILVGGSFNTYGGISKNNIVRINTNGTLDASFDIGTGADNNIIAIALQSDGKILIGGGLTSFNGTSRIGIARLTTSGSLDTSFDANCNDLAIITAIAIQPDGKILIGGLFSSIDGTSRNNIARLTTSGTIDTTFDPGTGTNTNVNSITIEPIGTIIITGQFTTYNGISRSYIARLNSDGSLNTDYNPTSVSGSYIQQIAYQQDGKFLICGNFTSYDNSSRNNIARISNDICNSVDTTFTPGTGPNNTVESIALQSDGKILIGGQFTSYNDVARARFARLTSNGSLDTTLDPGTGANDSIKIIKVQSDSEAILGGDFTEYNGTTVGKITRVVLDSLDRSYDTGSGAESALVRSIVAQSDGKVVIVGDFITYNGTSRRAITRINSDGSLDTSFDPGTGSNTGNIHDIAKQTDDKFIIVGSFASYNGTARACVARINSDGSLDTSFDPGTGANAQVVGVGIQSDGKAIIGGNFTTYNNTSINRIARLTISGTLDNSFNPGTGLNNYYKSICFQDDGKSIITGTFTTYNGTSRNYIARVNTDGSLDTSFDPGTGFNAATNLSVIQPDGKILIGGQFTSYNGTSRNYIARVAISGSLDTSFDPGVGPDAQIQGLDLQSDGKILIGGQFTTYAGVNRLGIARLNSDGSLDTSFDPGTGAYSLTAGKVGPIYIQSDNKAIITGWFINYNGISRVRVARVNLAPVGNLDQSFIQGTGFNDSVNSIDLKSNKQIITGGAFTSYDGITRNKIAGLLRDGDINIDFVPTTLVSGEINSVCVQTNDKIIAGGEFIVSGNKYISRPGRQRGAYISLPYQGLDGINSYPISNEYISSTGYFSATGVGHVFCLYNPIGSTKYVCVTGFQVNTIYSGTPDSLITRCSMQRGSGEPIFENIKSGAGIAKIHPNSPNSSASVRFGTSITNLTSTRIISCFYYMNRNISPDAYGLLELSENPTDKPFIVPVGSSATLFITDARTIQVCVIVRWYEVDV